ncbi:hypothetical protein [Actinomadura flavalba]|uniref:hypothetical protein n=1 Tax=Actinomadura flavalba TaxID=1120938 RepID=UPI0012DEC363|nr:hypothetical protein [Actinomadura flavalba]
METPEGRARLLSGACAGDFVVAGRAAAWVWGLDVLPAGVGEMRCPADDPACGQNTEGRPVPVPDGHVETLAGLRVTSRSRTALDCARWLPRLHAVAALDQFLRLGVDRGDLRVLARELDGYHRNKRLSAVLRAGDEGAQSPGESWTRTQIIDAGFPPPATQCLVPGPRGSPYLIDLGYDHHRVGLEYDGERHHTGRTARAHDDARLRWLRKEQGWTVITVTKDVLHRPAPYLEALLTALLDRDWKPDEPTLARITLHLHRLRRRPFH